MLLSWVEGNLESISSIIAPVRSVCFGTLSLSSNYTGVCGAVLALGELKRIDGSIKGTKEIVDDDIGFMMQHRAFGKITYAKKVLPRNLFVLITPKPLEYHFRVIHSTPPQQLHSNSRTHCRIQPGPLQCPASFPPAVCVAAPTHDLDPTGNWPVAYH